MNNIPQRHPEYQDLISEIARQETIMMILEEELGETVHVSIPEVVAPRCLKRGLRNPCGPESRQR
jgi:hypothetical protein